jgi:hypothetical protein
MDVYVYAPNDYMARTRAHKLADKIDADVTEIGEQPFASMSYRKLDNHSKPSPKGEDGTLPF